MIKVFSNHHDYITVNKKYPEPYVGIKDSAAGTLRYRQHSLEAFDGYEWFDVTATIEVSLTPKMLHLLTYIENKMAEDLKIKDLITRVPALKTAHDEYELAKALVLEQHT